MKKIVLFILLSFLACTQVHAQKGVGYYKKMFKQAKQYQDVEMATMSLHHIIALGSEEYKDTLAEVYTNNNKPISGYLLCKELLEKRPKNKQLLEYMFTNCSNIGYTEGAVKHIDLLISQEPNNITYHYQKSNLLVNTGQYSNALEALNTGLALADIDKQIMADGIKGNRITVPIQAELYLLKGVVYHKLKDQTGAQEAFTKALQLAPEHKVANNNLAILKTKEPKITP